MPSILFVCTANQFRSPIAALYFAREVVRHDDDKDFRISSAGTWAFEGIPATAKAVQIAQDYKFDLSFHRSRLISSEIISGADLILVMESGQKEGILHDYPSADGKLYLLTEAAGKPPVDIPDPYTTAASAEEVALEIIRLIDEGYDKIIELAWNLAEKI